MKFRSTLVAAALLNAVLVTSLTMAPVMTTGAEMALDPAIGTWAPKSSVRTYSATPDGLKVVIHSVTATGEPHDMSSSFSYDGRQHPVTGSEDYDTIAVTRTGANESKSEFIKGGKVIGHLTRSVSGDGKTMTVTSDLTNAKGTKVHDVAVFDRQ